MNEERIDKRLDLIKVVEAGAKAADLCGFLMPVLARRKKLLVDKLENGSFYYQKIDNSELLVIQLELKLLKQISDEAAELIQTGEESAVTLRAMDEPKESEPPKRRLRY